MACFCHTDGLPHYHGRYPLPGNHRIDELGYRLWQVFRQTVRPRLLEIDHHIVNQDLLWEFKAAGLEKVQINGHLPLVSPGDARLSDEEAAAYALARLEMTWEWLNNLWAKYSHELAAAGFGQAEFDELHELKRIRGEYLRADPTRARDVMEVYTDPLLNVRGTKPTATDGQETAS